MQGIRQEAIIFLCACLSGVVIAVVYQIVLILRRLIKHSWFFMNLEDVLYWIGTGGYLFYQMYCTTYGIVRWYFVLGIVMGFALAKWGCHKGTQALLKLQKKLEKMLKNR